MDPQLAELIRRTAQSLMIDPVDLATAISYETGGTFDPMQPGPRTKWGQHRGLIQFGEPQAQQFGVDWNDPLRSQLGEDGAIAKYLRANGFKPGMSGLDLYSTINAGAPGRYGASDTAAGGAPGDVRDKWMNQMSGHRKKAEALILNSSGRLGGDSMVARDHSPEVAAQMSTPAFDPNIPGQTGPQMVAEAAPATSGLGALFASLAPGAGAMSPAAEQGGPAVLQQGDMNATIAAQQGADQARDVASAFMPNAETMMGLGGKALPKPPKPLMAKKQVGPGMMLVG